jgi:hypothetical protein
MDNVPKHNICYAQHMFAFFRCNKNEHIHLQGLLSMTLLLLIISKRREDVEGNQNTRRWQYGQKKNIKNLRGFSPPANYNDRATAACRRS